MSFTLTCATLLLLFKLVGKINLDGLFKLIVLNLTDRLLSFLYNLLNDLSLASTRLFCLNVACVLWVILCLSRCDWGIFCLIIDHSLHLCQSVIKSCFFKLHLQVINFAHFNTSDETASESLDCNRRFQNKFLDVLSLLCQRYDLVLHEALVLMHFSFHLLTLGLELGKQFLLLVDWLGELRYFLWWFVQVTWRGRNDLFWIQIVARLWLGLRTAIYGVQTSCRRCLCWSPWHWNIVVPTLHASISSRLCISWIILIRTLRRVVMQLLTATWFLSRIGPLYLATMGWWKVGLGQAFWTLAPWAQV